MTADEAIDYVLEEAGMDADAMLRVIVKGLLNNHHRKIAEDGEDADTAFDHALDAFATELRHAMYRGQEEFDPKSLAAAELAVEIDHLDYALGLLQNCLPDDDDEPASHEDAGPVTVVVQGNRPIMRLVRDEE